MSTVAWGTLAEVPVGLGHTGGPMLARPGLTGVHFILAQTALESRGAAAEIGGAAVHAEASILAQGGDFYALAQRSFLAGSQWQVAERPSPSLKAQAVKGGSSLEAAGVEWTWLLGTEIHQCLAAASRVARWAEAAGTLRAVLAGCLVTTGTVCTVAASPSLTAWALEAQCADAEGGVWHAHTGASIEARC